MTREIYRILDANLNRSVEGLRVVEDILRFLLEDAELARAAKELRHQVVQDASLLPLKEWDLVLTRDADTDVGRRIQTRAEMEREDVRHVLLASFKRVQQSLRVLEEFAKIESVETAEKFCEARFQAYQLEKEVANRFARPELDLTLYVITGEEFARGRPVVQVVREAIAGGATAIQLREKDWPVTKLVQVGKEIRRITREAGVTFIVNDRVDVALAVDADGVHLGQDDMPYREARKILGPNKIIGISTHSVEEALRAQEEGADYIGVGPIFSTTSKKVLTPIVGTELLEQLRGLIKIPYVGIGGINVNNAEKVIRAGAWGVAVISAVTGAPQVMQAARELRQVVERARRERYGQEQEVQHRLHR